MSLNSKIPKKISFVPKKHHGFQLVIFLLGCLLPPLAVALRFGIGGDFFINTFLCICGYFPCHIHNFYIQNIRNNANKGRTPKWAAKAGLIDTSDQERRTKKSQWAKRFDERNPQSTHLGQSLEEGEEGADYMPVSEAEREAAEHRRNEGLWTGEDETYYNEDPNRAPNQNKWHYPANFEGAAVGDGGRAMRSGAGRANANGDRWERSRASRADSYSSGSTYPPAGATDDDVPEWGRDYGSKRRNTKNKKQKGAGGAAGVGKGGWANNGGYVDDIGREDGWGGAQDGGARPNGNAARANGNAARANGNAAPTGREGSGGDIFEHEF